MADVLSQDEIDAILNAFNTGQVSADLLEKEPEKTVKTYDFKRPSKFSRDHLRTLELIHETYGRLVATSLSSLVRGSMRFDFSSIDQVPYEEFINSLIPPAMIVVISWENTGLSMVVEMNLNITLALVDRLLGGSGLPPPSPRAPTDIETALISKLVDRHLVALEEAWRTVYPVSLSFVGTETNPEFAQVVPANEMVVLITMDIGIGDLSGIMSLAIPYSLLEPIVNHLSAQRFFVKKKAENDLEKEYVYQHVLNVIVNLQVCLGHMQIPLKDLVNLRVGDTLLLDRKVNRPLEVKVEKKQKFLGIPGRVGKNLAIKINDLMRE
jgi:flagellar motor switch protein FliM